MEWLKTLTGQDDVAFERKGKDAVWKKVTGGFFLTSNEYPEILKQVPGLERRIFPLSFPRVVPEAERVNILANLKDTDKSWFLHEALKIYHRYKTEDMGLVPYEDTIRKADLVENPLHTYFRENYEIDMDYKKTLIRDMIAVHDAREDRSTGHFKDLKGDYNAIRTALRTVFSEGVARIEGNGQEFKRRYREGMGYVHLKPKFDMEKALNEARRGVM